MLVSGARRSKVWAQTGDWWGRRFVANRGNPHEDDIVLSVEQPFQPTYEPPYGGVFREEIRIGLRTYRQIRTTRIQFTAAAGGGVTEVIGEATFNLNGLQQAFLANQSALIGSTIFDFDGTQQALLANQTFLTQARIFDLDGAQQNFNANQSAIIPEAIFNWDEQALLANQTALIESASFNWQGQAFIEVQDITEIIGNATFLWIGQNLTESGEVINVFIGNIYRNLVELPPPKIAFQIWDIDRDTPNVLP